MSKKLIAVAAAAALALTGLVGIAPANANVTIAYTTGDNPAQSKSVTPSTTLAAETAATALIDVPAANTLAFSSGVSRNNLIKASVTTSVGQVVNVVTTGAVKIVDAPTNTTDKKYTSASGVTTYNVTADSSSVVFYIFTTSTSAGTVKTTVGGNSSTIFVKGLAGPAYNLTATMPAVIPATLPSSNNLIAKVTDVFGNQITEAVQIDTRVAGAGGVISASADFTYSETEGGHGMKLHATGSGAMGVDLTFNSADSPTDVTGLANAVKTWFGNSNAADLAGQVAALSAQVASLQALMSTMRTFERSVTKKKYNTLARKWNRAFPSQAVKLKPPLVK